jgi:5-deoxy-glucuronate isomerase
VTGSPWVGLKHFNTFIHSFYFGQLIGNTLYFSLAKLILGIPLAIVLAIALRNILTASDQPDLPAQRLIVGETLVPSGNWSTYPPHKHEVDDLPREAFHEELYYFRVDLPGGFGHARHYSLERGYDTTYAVQDSTILMLPHGYHTTCSAPGYTNYFLWMLAGEHRTQAVAFDPNHAWVQKTIGLLKGR